MRPHPKVAVSFMAATSLLFAGLAYGQEEGPPPLDRNLTLDDYRAKVEASLPEVPPEMLDAPPGEDWLTNLTIETIQSAVSDPPSFTESFFDGRLALWRDADFTRFVRIDYARGYLRYANRARQFDYEHSPHEAIDESQARTLAREVLDGLGLPQLEFGESRVETVVGQSFSTDGFASDPIEAERLVVWDRSTNGYPVFDSRVLIAVSNNAEKARVLLEWPPFRMAGGLQLRDRPELVDLIARAIQRHEEGAEVTMNIQLGYAAVGENPSERYLPVARVDFSDLLSGVIVVIPVTRSPDDQDYDGVPDNADNCPDVYNPFHEDADGDGIGDLCDNCLYVANQDQADSNENGIGDECDEPIGACCLSDGMCDVITATACFLSGGTYLGDGIECPGLACIPHVNAAATGDESGWTWQDALRDVQSALGRCRQNPAIREVWVATGEYVPDPEQMLDRNRSFELIEGVELLGGFAGTERARDERDPALHETILSGDLLHDTGWNSNYADDSYHVVSAREVGPTAVLDGFTIRYGNADGSGPPDYTDAGGGLRISDGAAPTVRHCRFFMNRGKFGGAIELFKGGGTFENCTFTNNTADPNDGGAISCNRSTPTLRDCTFENNEARGTGGGGGGGVRVASANPMLIGCTFIGNSAPHGGALMSVRGSPVMVNCEFRGNSASTGGGAVSHLVSGTPEYVNCLFVGNRADSGRAGQMESDGGAGASVSQCTLLDGRASQYGGVLQNGGALHCDNNILYFNAADSGSREAQQIAVTSGGQAELMYCLVEGWTGNLSGEGNFGADPKVVARGQWTGETYVSGDAHLQLQSPAIDAGDNYSVPADAADLDADLILDEPLPLDFDGMPRFFDVHSVSDTGHGEAPIVDIGAFEHQSPPPLLGDMDCDGVVGFNDIDGFVTALISREEYESTYLDCYYADGDIDADGAVTFNDIDGFVDCLINGGCP